MAITTPMAPPIASVAFFRKPRRVATKSLSATPDPYQTSATALTQGILERRGQSYKSLGSCDGGPATKADGTENSAIDLLVALLILFTTDAELRLWACLKALLIDRLFAFNAHAKAAVVNLP